MLSNREIEPLKLISIISSLLLLQFVSSIQSSESCPSHCVCSSLQDSLSSAQCQRFPRLEQLTDDLHILQIESAEICPIARNLRKFTQLKTLSVSNCAIDVNVESFTDLNNLQTVTFHNTSIISVDPSLFEFNRNLKSVNFSSNPLKIWRHFLISASIEQVDLTGCGLKEIPKKAFSQILNLKRLILKDNGLKTFDYILPNSLNFLDLSDNKLGNISLRVFRPLINLKEIDLSGNPLICSCKLKLIEKYLLFKNVSFTKPVECVNEITSRPFTTLDQISLKNVCKLRDNLNEKAFVTKLLKRLRRSVDWNNEYIEKSKFFANEAEIIDSLDENVANSSEIMNVLEAKMKYIDEEDEGDKDGSADSDEDDKKSAEKKDDDEEEDDGSEEKDKNDSSPEEGDDDHDPDDDGDVRVGDGDGGSDDDDSIMGLDGVLMLIAATIMLLVILVIGIIVALVVKFLSQMNSGNECDFECVANNACEESTNDHGECQIPMMSRRSSTRKGTACRICPSTMSSRRSGRTCYCNRGTYSDTDTVVNDCQFDSNPTSACTTFERSSRC